MIPVALFHDTLTALAEISKRNEPQETTRVIEEVCDNVALLLPNVEQHQPQPNVLSLFGL